MDANKKSVERVNQSTAVRLSHHLRSARVKSTQVNIATGPVFVNCNANMNKANPLAWGMFIKPSKEYNDVSMIEQGDLLLYNLESYLLIWWMFDSKAGRWSVSHIL